MHCYLKEVAALKLVRDRKLMGKSPLLHHGFLDDAQALRSHSGSGDWRWPYIVMDFVRGDPIGDVHGDLSDQNWTQVLCWLANNIRTLHALPLGDIELHEALGDADDFEMFLMQQRRSAAERHTKFGSMSLALLAQLESYLPSLDTMKTALGYSNASSTFIHGDIHEENLLGVWCDHNGIELDNDDERERKQQQRASVANEQSPATKRRRI
jgi:hypothetical protein